VKTLALLFLLVVGPTVGDEASLVGEIPPPPADGIYDPEQWLTSGARSEMSQNIAIARDKRGAEVFVIILPGKSKPEDQLFARKVAKEWGRDELWGIVLHVIDDPEFPKFFCDRRNSSGWNKEQDQSFELSLTKALDYVKSRALREGDPPLQVQTGTRELTKELGYLGLVVSRIDQRNRNARGDFGQARKTWKNNRKFLRGFLMVGIPLTLVLLGFLLFFISRKRNKRGPNFHFPETSPSLRFHAPWSGGGNVIIKFSPQVKRDGLGK